MEDISITLSEHSKMVCFAAKRQFPALWKLWLGLNYCIKTFFCEAQSGVISNSYLNAKYDLFFSSFHFVFRWYSWGHALQLSCNEAEIVWCRSKACQGTYWLSERVRPTHWWWLSWAAIYIAPAIHDSCPPPVCRSLSARSPIYLSISICWVTTLGSPL